MKYGEIIERAVRITWRNKVLWVFGIALALFGGMGGGGNPGSNLQYSFGRGDWERWVNGMPSNWDAIASALLAIIGVIALLALIVGILGILVRYTSIGALIGLTAKIEAGEKPDFGSGLRCGWRHLLRLFAVNLVLAIAGFLVALVIMVVFAALGAVIVLPAIAMFGAEGGWIALGVLWIVLLGIAWLGLLVAVTVLVGGAFGVVREYAYRGCVLQEQGVFESLSEGVSLLRTRLKQSAAMWLLLMAINLAIGIVLFPILLLIAAGTGVSFATLFATSRSSLLGALIGAPLILLGGLAMLFASGIYGVFQSVVWTLFYQELQPQAEA